MWMNVHSTVMTVTQMHSALTLWDLSRAHVTIQTTTTATGKPAILTVSPLFCIIDFAPLSPDANRRMLTPS